MLKIGEFSKLSHLTVKALRFYEKEGILLPASTDEWTGYRFYETSQLEAAARIRAYRQLELSIDEIKAIIAGTDARQILSEKAKTLAEEKNRIDKRLSIINHIMEDKDMKYQVTEKQIPEKIIYSSETVMKHYSDIMQWIPSPYEFCEYPDGEYKETDIRIRHNEAVTMMGRENEKIRFRILPPVKVLSIFHKGPYDSIGDAYAYIMKYAEQNNYKPAGLARECYIDGIWNKESPEEWLTEIQLPIE